MDLEKITGELRKVANDNGVSFSKNKEGINDNLLYIEQIVDEVEGELVKKYVAENFSGEKYVLPCFVDFGIYEYTIPEHLKKVETEPISNYKNYFSSLTDLFSKNNKIKSGGVEKAYFGNKIKSYESDERKILKEIFKVTNKRYTQKEFGNVFSKKFEESGLDIKEWGGSDFKPNETEEFILNSTQKFLGGRFSNFKRVNRGYFSYKFKPLGSYVEFEIKINIRGSKKKMNLITKNQRSKYELNKNFLQGKDNIKEWNLLRIHETDIPLRYIYNSKIKETKEIYKINMPDLRKYMNHKKAKNYDGVKLRRPRNRF